MTPPQPHRSSIEGAVCIARCDEHGLHGERTECFVCGGPVTQVPMVSADSLAEAEMQRDMAEAHLNPTIRLLQGRWLAHEQGVDEVVARLLAERDRYRDALERIRALWNQSAPAQRQDVAYQQAIRIASEALR